MSVMNQKDHSIIKTSNINSDIIVVNQSDENRVEEFEYKNHAVKFMTFNERGVGLSRNTALMRADADIVLFADDDVTYHDGYADKIIAAFQNNPSADIIMFNLSSTNNERPSGDHVSRKRVRKYNSLKYGTYRMAGRLDSLRNKNLNFSLLFGGGAKYSSGEDSLFIFSALNSGLKIIAEPISIGEVSHQESTWFSGYSDKFFYDKGVLYSHLSRHFAKLLCLQFILRKYATFNTKTPRVKLLKQMLNGVKDSRL